MAQLLFYISARRTFKEVLCKWHCTWSTNLLSTYCLPMTKGHNWHVDYLSIISFCHGQAVCTWQVLLIALDLWCNQTQWVESLAYNILIFYIIVQGIFNYRLITAYLLLWVNLDKIMHARWDFDASSAQTQRVSALDKHQNWTASALFCLNSRAQSKYAVVNLIHTRRKQFFFVFYYVINKTF